MFVSYVPESYPQGKKHTIMAKDTSANCKIIIFAIFAIKSFYQIGDKENLDSRYFWDYFEDNKCPKCGKVGQFDDYAISNDNEEIIRCWCNHCGHKYKIHIQFDCE